MGRAWYVRTGGEYPVRIRLTSVFVDDQAKALRFYTEILGFLKKHDVPVGEKDRWLTVVSPDEPGGTELLPEPAGHPAARAYRDALVRDGIPLAQFAVEAVYERLRGLGVRFTQEPVVMGPVTTAVFDDTVAI